MSGQEMVAVRGAELPDEAKGLIVAALMAAAGSVMGDEAGESIGGKAMALAALARLISASTVLVIEALDPTADDSPPEPMMTMSA